MSGMPTIRSHSSRVSRRNPAPSAPSTHATGPLTSASNRLSPPASAPRIQTPLRLEVPQRPREIGDGDDRDRVGGAARCLGHRRIDPDRAVLRDDDRVRAERVGVAQAGAEVVRIGDAVEDEQQRRFGERVEHVVQRDVGNRGVDDGDDALVPVRTGERTETLVVGHVDRAASGFGARGEITRARVVSRRSEIDGAHRRRPLPQPRGHRVETMERAGGSQGWNRGRVPGRRRTGMVV